MKIIKFIYLIKEKILGYNLGLEKILEINRKYQKNLNLYLFLNLILVVYI